MPQSHETTINKKIVATVLYRFVHEHSATHMVDYFNVAGSTI